MFPCLPHGQHGCDCEAPPRAEQKLSRTDYSSSVRLSLEQGVTDPHDARAYPLNDPEAKQA